MAHSFLRMKKWWHRLEIQKGILKCLRCSRGALDRGDLHWEINGWYKMAWVAHVGRIPQMAGLLFPRMRCDLEDGLWMGATLPGPQPSWFLSMRRFERQSSQTNASNKTISEISNKTSHSGSEWQYRVMAKGPIFKRGLIFVLREDEHTQSRLSNYEPHFFQKHVSNCILKF